MTVQPVAPPFGYCSLHGFYDLSGQRPSYQCPACKDPPAWLLQPVPAEVAPVMVPKPSILQRVARMMRTYGKAHW